MQLAVVLAFALPLAAFGGTRFLGGDPLGLVFVGLAAAMLVLQHVLTNPFSPDDVAEAAVDRVLPDDDP